MSFLRLQCFLTQSYSKGIVNKAEQILPNEEKHIIADDARHCESLEFSNFLETYILK